jgi:G3E family GTPase
MNAVAKILRTQNASVPIPEVLDVGGFDLDRAVATKPEFLTPEYPFEWAGTFELDEGVYDLVVDDGPDPKMDAVVQLLGRAEAAHDQVAAERAVRTWSQEAQWRVPGDQGLDVGSTQPYTLRLETKGQKRFTLRVSKPSRVGLYTQHLPAEFALTLSRAGARCEPIAELEFAVGHTHDEEVGSVGLHLEGAIDGDRLDKWLSQLLREKGIDIFRMKGILNMKGSDNRFVFQGVHMLFDGREDRPWGSAVRASDMVFIGKNLDRAALVEGFSRCLE